MHYKFAMPGEWMTFLNVIVRIMMPTYEPRVCLFSGLATTLFAWGALLREIPTNLKICIMDLY